MFLIGFILTLYQIYGLQIFSIPWVAFSFSFFSFFLLAASGLHCCMWAFSSCGEPGLLFVEVHGLLIVVASLVAEHGL